MATTLTAKQWRMLEILETWSGHGTIEVEIQWGDYDCASGNYPTDAEDARGWNACRLVVLNLVRSLVRKGYAEINDDGYCITDAGLAALAQRREEAGP